MNMKKFEKSMKPFKSDTEVWEEACKKNRHKRELLKSLPVAIYLAIAYLCLFFYDDDFCDFVASWFK